MAKPNPRGLVSPTINVDKLFSWSRNFDVNPDETIPRVVYYPDANTEVHFTPDAGSVTALQNIRDQILAIMVQTVDLSGTETLRLEKQLVDVLATQKEEWVQTFP